MLGEILKNRYRIDRTLAQGGCGIVYEAFDKKNRRPVALKQLILSASFIHSAFIREAKILKALHHPSFPEVYDQFELKDSHFLVMEYFAGKDLAKRLFDNGEPFPLRKVLNWAIILLDALHYLHTFDSDNPIIHRDIKPENLKLNETNLIRRSEIILLDFGIAKGAAENISMRSAEISIVGGTRHYAPPEQLFKIEELVGKLSKHPQRLETFIERHTDARSDLYSLAATLYNLLTNTLPPDAVNRAVHLWNNPGDPLLPIHEINPKVPPLISDIIHRALSLEPDARFASADQMRSALDSALSDELGKVPQMFPSAPSSTPQQTKTTIVSNPDEAQPHPTQMAFFPVRHGLLGECDSAVRSIAFSPRGTHLASGSNDGLLRMWDVITGEVEIIHRCEPGDTGLSYISSVSFSPDGERIASVGNDRVIRLSHISPASANTHRELAFCPNVPRSVAFSPCGKYLAVGGSDGAVHLFDAFSGESTLLGHCKGAVWSVAFTPESSDGTSVAAESDDATILVWHLESRQLTKMQSFDNDIRSISVSQNGEFIASGGSDCYLRFARFGEKLMTDLAICDGGIRSVAFSPDSSKIAIGSEDKLVRIFDRVTNTLDVLGECEDVVAAVAFRADGRTVASGSWDKTIRLWDFKSKIS